MKKEKLFRMVLLSLYLAIMIVMDLSPLGYIVTPAFSLTLMYLPVIFGAITLGPKFGALLGGFFGLTSFLQCFGIGYANDPSASILFNASPLSTFIVCFAPRILMGVGVGLLYNWFSKIMKSNMIPCLLASVSAVILNTTLFMTGYIVLFKNTILSGMAVKSVVLSALTLNSLVELIAAIIVGTSVSMALTASLKRLSK